jgi:polyferredoxin
MVGLVGNPVGNRNAAIIMIWVFWFFLMIALLVPLGGRAWCMMCPLPAPAEWLSRLAIVRRGRKKMLNLGWRWPKRLNNIWLQNFGFLTVAAFSPIILTRPVATAYLLLGLIILAVIMGLTFIRQAKGGRVFCKYVCPVGGFIGLYSLMGSLEIKVKDPKVCLAHKEKPCVTGSAVGYGCPWYEYPGNMDRNLYCGLCTECVKTCTEGNIVFRTRLMGADLLKNRKMDEAFKSFIMLGSGLMFIAVFFGWWGGLKDAANFIDGGFLGGPVNWTGLALYAGLVWTVSLVILPALHAAAVWAAGHLGGKPALKRQFIDYAYAYVPLGLAAWTAFVVGMLMVNATYILNVISDPFGWGWDLIGTASIMWQPMGTAAIPYIQLGLLLVGLAGSIYVVHRLSREHFQGGALRAMVPIVVLLILVSVAYEYLLVMV